MSSGNVDLQTVVCPECHRGFRRISNLKRHKCIAEREKPIHEQKEPLNARHLVRSTFEAKEAMQYTNASLLKEKLFMTLSLSPLKR